MEKYSLGGDAIKGYCDFVIIDPEKNIIEKNFQLDDTFSGHTELKRIISNLFLNQKGSVIYARAESTGGYENNSYKMILQDSIRLVFITVPRAIFERIII